ncbi:MAG: PqqD family protein [Clostridia bacterium]|nr:PqqD family protein [Clostridia bacterium]
MKLREDFALKQIAGTFVVLPLGKKTVDFTGMLTLNETGRMLWELLSNGCSRDGLAEALVREYGIPMETALTDVDEYLDKLMRIGCLE